MNQEAELESVLLAHSPWQGTWHLSLTRNGTFALTFLHTEDGNLAAFISETRGARRSPDGPVTNLSVNGPLVSFVTASGVSVRFTFKEGKLSGLGKGNSHVFMLYPKVTDGASHT